MGNNNSSSPGDLGNQQPHDTRKMDNDEYDEVDLPGEVSRACTGTKHDKVNDSPDSCPSKRPYDNVEEYDEVPDQHVEDPNGKDTTVDNTILPNTESSLTMFHNEYENLDETDSPHPDPGANLESFGERNINELDLQDFPLLNRRKLKTKTLVRSRSKCEGIVSTHTTYFPEKLNKGHQEYSPENAIPISTYYYDMSSFPRGVFTMFNIEHYLRSTGMADYPRKGTERDADGLCALFLELGFIVERYDNPTKKMLFSALDNAASETGSLSCCACAILTHGEEGILYSIDSSLKIKDVTKRFRSRSLAGKPKLFLFQACQGSDYMDAIDACDGPIKDDDELSLPSEADFFYAYSTVPGYYSWRNSRHGSWFMQALCQVFRHNAHSMDLYRMLTRVNDLVSSRKSRTDDSATDDKRQIASLVSQMRKELYFFPPYGPLVT